MWKQVKQIVQLGFGLLLSTAVLLVGYSMLTESSADKNSALVFTGPVTSRVSGKLFTFSLAGTAASFSIYNASRTYGDLEVAINIGDTLTVYTVDSKTANLQVLQVEKRGQVVVDKKLLQGQNRTGGIIALIGGVVMLCLCIWQFKKKKA